MSKFVNVEFQDEDQYARVERIKDENAMTWRAMLIRAADSLEGEDAAQD